MIIPIEATVNVMNEWQTTPTHMRVELTVELLNWIRKMMRVVKRNKIAYLAEYECSPEYFNEDDRELNPCEESLECVMIVICKDEFYWKGLIKNTDISFESDTIPITRVDELIKFSQDPKEMENLPTYINDEDYSKREIALRRMRGET
jgi:hypothetical protein